ncbi:MAG: low molecular weight phosphotyrosine protein phosphatase [Bacteroidetes bacterium]|nr:low molecular weight phosphotyrosine protein phosphatase [Bacteroidota bacterium]
MNRILFVCLGNICRSPMAEGILRHKAEHQGIKLNIDSAGTGNWHVGEHPDKRATKAAKDHGLDISSLVARQMTEDDFEKFDMIYVADTEVYDGVVNIALNREHKLKVDYIMNLVHPDLNQPVPDPYFGGAEGFENVFNMLDKACDAIISKIKTK